MKFSIKEIIDMAVELEKTGGHFYTECAAKFGKNDRLKELVQFLASEEAENEKIFKSMLEGIGEPEGNFTDEYYEYLSALISGRIFSSSSAVDSFVEDIADHTDALYAAIQAEKDSILFYSELKEMYEGDPDKASVVSRLIEAERTHLIKLNHMLKD